MEGSAKLFFILALCLGTMIQTLHANIAVYDDVWHKRAAEAKKNTMEAYVPHVMEVSNDKKPNPTKVSVASAHGDVPIPSTAVPKVAATGPVKDREGKKVRKMM
ncbi:hypothetical protein LINPERHAP2_LOCUS24714 [Linum perenne]